tara:strand:+ start:2270 stop:2449 length:180 start_codon:yes stop_codon:yes gene_type:complete
MSVLENKGPYENQGLSLLTEEEYNKLHSSLQKKYKDLYGEVFLQKAWIVVDAKKPVGEE